MKIRRIIPTRNQWSKWSMPAKYTVLSVFLAIGLFMIDKILNYCNTPNPHEKTIAYYQAAVNQFKEKDYDETVIELQKALEIEPDHVPSVELLAEIFIREKNKTEEAKDALISVKDRLSEDGKIMLMFLYYNYKEIDKADDMSKKINLQKAKINWAQFFYLIKCNIFIKKNDLSTLREFIATSVNELNQQIIGLHPMKLHDNPYDTVKYSGPLVPIDYLQASSARFALAGFSATNFENDDAAKIKNIKASFAEYGFGISAWGVYSVTPSMAITFLKTILSNYNSSRTLKWSDIKLTFLWLKQISIALNGKIIFNLPGVESSDLTISFNSGATNSDIEFVNSTINDFKNQYKLDDNGDRINKESYQISK